MKMRKIIAVLAAVLMLCAIVPMGVFAAPGDVVIDKNFDDGSYFSNGSNENGYMVFDATKGDWYNVYLYANAIKNATKYEITFDCKANKATNINVKINNNWSGDTFKWTTNVTTEWETYSCVITTNELAELTSTALLMFTSNATAANGAVYHIDNVVVKEYLDPTTIGQIKNGDFETGDLSGWSKHQSTTISTDAHSGSYAANIKGDGGWGGMLNQDVPVTAGKSYEISLWVKANSNGTNVQIKDGGTSGTVIASKWYTSTSWSQLTWTVIPTTDVICFNFCGGGNGIAEDVLVDDIVISELKDPSFDGYITNGDFETGKTAPWDIYSSTAVSAEAAKSGEYGMILSGGANWGGIANQSFTVEPGKTYVIRFDACVVSQGVNVQIKDNGTKVGGSYISKTEWTTYTYDFTPNSANANLNFCGSGTAGGDVVYLDNVMVYEKVEQSNDGYIVNGTFDTGALTPWNNLWGSCPTAEVVVGGKDSTFARHVVSGQWKHVRQMPIAVEPNTDYKVTVWSKNSANISLLVKGLADDKNTETTDLRNVSLNSGDEWTQFTNEFNSGDHNYIIVSFMGNTAEGAEGYFDTVVMEKLHTCNVVEQERVEADCENDGYIKYACDCGLGEYTEVIPAAHTYDNNCDFDCNVCGEYRDAPHNLTTHVEAVVPANCQEQGHNEYWVCADCGGYFMSNGAGGYYETNPAWMYYTGDHVRPEDAIVCAVVACELCGEDTYGEPCTRPDGAPECTDVACANCGETIYGWGHNYNTGDEEIPLPLCGEGDCVYCGEHFDKLYDHENGAWAPCLDGECSYGCGLQYPATEEHTVENPCAGGTCSVCWNEVEPAHEYFYACDQYCMNCNELTNPDAAHSIIHVEAKSAVSCIEYGNKEHWYCEHCGTAWLDEALTRQTNMMSVRVAGECVSDAEYACKDGVCVNCGLPCDAEADHEYFNDCDAVCMICNEVTREVSHNVNHVEAAEGTCQQMGNVEYWYCDVCGAAWLDEACTQITNLRSVITGYGEHKYDHIYDADCNTCEKTAAEDDTIQTVVLPIVTAGKSVSEDVSGLAFLFTMNVSGMNVIEGTATAVYNDAMVDGYKLISMGATLSNYKSSKKVEAVYLYDLEEDTASFTTRVINIPAEAYDKDITAVPFFVVEIDGVEVEIVCDSLSQTYTYNGVANSAQ